MPSTYAHYIFGQQIRGRLSGYERKVIDKYPELFNIGLHGPDILFYYRPLGKNKFMQQRFYIHTTSMRSIWLMYMECSAILRWM